MDPNLWRWRRRVAGLRAARCGSSISANLRRDTSKAGNRPALVVSVDKFNHGPADLVVVMPISKAAKGIPLHVEIDPPEGGVTMRSFIKCEAIRSIAKVRLVRLMGRVSDKTIESVEDHVKILLDLHP